MKKRRRKQTIFDEIRIEEKVFADGSARGQSEKVHNQEGKKEKYGTNRTRSGRQETEQTLRRYKQARQIWNIASSKISSGIAAPLGQADLRARQGRNNRHRPGCLTRWPINMPTPWITTPPPPSCPGERSDRAAAGAFLHPATILEQNGV